MKVRVASLLVLLLCATTAFADEINLKDGSKIVGTVIGFEDNSFKVQTSFGIITFPKNMIASIVPSAAAPSVATPSTAKNSTATPPVAMPSSAIDTSSSKQEHKAEAKKETPAEVKKAPEEKKVAIQPVRTVAKKPVQSTNEPAAVTSASVVSNRTIEKPDATVAIPQPPVATKDPEVPAIREAVHGNQYLNYTYGFRMYKAPSWNLIDDDTRKTLPNAIVALGASDDSTLMVVGVEGTKESIEARAAATEKRLREIYENYRRTFEQKTLVAGLPAIERRYRGMADGHDWSGIVVTFARGNDVYTLLGMTYADSDLIQIQENVISRAIASLDFAPK